MLLAGAAAVLVPVPAVPVARTVNSACGKEVSSHRASASTVVCLEQQGRRQRAVQPPLERADHAQQCGGVQAHLVEAGPGVHGGGRGGQFVREQRAQQELRSAARRGCGRGRARGGGGAGRGPAGAGRLAREAAQLRHLPPVLVEELQDSDSRSFVRRTASAVIRAWQRAVSGALIRNDS
ncbi:hypothetical protein O1L55_09755 [Streptomyces albulus]|nr:hypothetical protein [Streptomyces noursei]